MSMFLAVVSVVLVYGAPFIVVMNAGAAFYSIRNRRRGIDKHYSLVPLAAQFLLFTAAILSPSVPRWGLVAIALADLSLWQLLYMPLFLLRRRGKT